MKVLQEIIVQDILRMNYFNIEKVLSMEEVKTIEYSIMNKDHLTYLLGIGDYAKINEFSERTELFSDDLSIVRFRDGKQDLYYALCHSSLSPAFDFKVLDVFQSIQNDYC